MPLFEEFLGRKKSSRQKLCMLRHWTRNHGTGKLHKNIRRWKKEDYMREKLYILWWRILHWRV